MFTKPILNLTIQLPQPDSPTATGDSDTRDVFEEEDDYIGVVNLVWKDSDNRLNPIWNWMSEINSPEAKGLKGHQFDFSSYKGFKMSSVAVQAYTSGNNGDVVESPVLKKGQTVVVEFISTNGQPIPKISVQS